MKIRLLFVVMLLCLCGCSSAEKNYEKQEFETIIELNEENYWKYFNVNGSGSGLIAIYHITGVLDFALYEDVVFEYDIVYHDKNESEVNQKSFTIKIGCNASGDASFTISSTGNGNVTIGKWYGVVSGESVNLEKYQWEVKFKSITGKVKYTI